MIRFPCPRCRTPLEVDDSQAGVKLHCSNCTQRLQVPALTPKPAVVSKMPLAGWIAVGIFAVFACCGLVAINTPHETSKATSPVQDAKNRPNPPRDGAVFMGGDSRTHLRLFADLNFEVHQQGRQGLMQIRDRTAIRGLAKQLTDGPSVTHRHDAAECLGGIGETAWEAIPALKACAADDPDKDVRERALWALERIGE